MENPDPITIEQEKETETPDTTSVTDQTPSRNEFLTGLKLYLTLGSVTMVGFLISLDASIIVTVCLNQLHLFVLICKTNYSVGYPKNYSTLSFDCRHWMVW
jgi:hypothetical protein